VRLTDAEGGGTKLSYDVDAQVGGKIAQLGSRLIDSTAKKLADEFFTNFAKDYSTLLRNLDGKQFMDVSFVAGEIKTIIDGVGLMGHDDHTTGETADLTTLPSQTKRAAVLLYRIASAR